MPKLFLMLKYLKGLLLKRYVVTFLLCSNLWPRFWSRLIQTYCTQLTFVRKDIAWRVTAWNPLKIQAFFSTCLDVTGLTVWFEVKQKQTTAMGWEAVNPMTHKIACVLLKQAAVGTSTTSFRFAVTHFNYMSIIWIWNHLSLYHHRAPYHASLHSLHVTTKRYVMTGLHKREL